LGVVKNVERNYLLESSCSALKLFLTFSLSLLHKYSSS